MPTQKPADVWCVCGHHRSNHRFLDRGIGPCNGCECKEFKSRRKAREEKEEARDRLLVENMRKTYNSKRQ